VVGGDLGEDGEVALALGADAGGDGDAAVGLDLHPRALVGADAGALDIADQAEADPAAGGPEGRLFLVDEGLVADQLQRPLEDGRVVAAVVGQLGEVLEHDLLLHREGVVRDQVAPADLRPVQA
jgi:hypothetical protein